MVGLHGPLLPPPSQPATDNHQTGKWFPIKFRHAAVCSPRSRRRRSLSTALHRVESNWDARLKYATLGYTYMLTARRVASRLTHQLLSKLINAAFEVAKN